jgi:hypothetical protein
LIDIQPEILNAIKNKDAVVALESTIITHGMPYPHNLETAIEVEEIIRAEVSVEKNCFFRKNVKIMFWILKLSIQPTSNTFFTVFMVNARFIL